VVLPWQAVAPHLVGFTLQAWTDYARMMHGAGLDTEYIPCLIVVLAALANPEALWLEYLPPALGCAWALGYFWPRRHAWDWSRYGNLLLTRFARRGALLLGFTTEASRSRRCYRERILTRSRALLVALAVCQSHCRGPTGCRHQGHLAPLSLDRACVACVVSSLARIPQARSLPPLRTRNEDSHAPGVCPLS